MVARPDEGNSARLRKCCREGDDSCARAAELLSMGVPPSGFDEAFERTALHWAAWSGAARIAALLLDYKGQVEATDILGFTPLHLAAERGQVAVITLLLQHGAPTNARTTNGNTPLHYASNNGHTDAAIALLEAMKQRGVVDVRWWLQWARRDPLSAILNHDGESPADLSRRKGHHALTALLEGGTRPFDENASIPMSASKANQQHSPPTGHSSSPNSLKTSNMTCKRKPKVVAPGQRRMAKF